MDAAATKASHLRTSDHFSLVCALQQQAKPMALREARPRTMGKGLTGALTAFVHILRSARLAPSRVTALLFNGRKDPRSSSTYAITSRPEPIFT